MVTLWQHNVAVVMDKMSPGGRPDPPNAIGLSEFSISSYKQNPDRKRGKLPIKNMAGRYWFLLLERNKITA
jgi:hypothetical protein